MQDTIHTFFTEYADALNKGEISKIAQFYAATFTIGNGRQEIQTSNNIAFKASLWFRDFTTKWNDEISLEPLTITPLNTEGNTYTVAVRWSIRNAEGEEKKQQEISYTLQEEDGLHIIASDF